MAKKDTLLLDLLGLASVVGFGFAVYQIYKLTKGDKKSEELSSADGLNTMTYTLTNNTDQNQVEYLFDSRSRQNNPNVGISPSMDFFNNELSNKPKRLIKIEFRNINSSSFSNVTALPPSGTGDITIGGGGTIGTPPPTPPPTPPIVDPSTPSTPSRNQSEAPFKMTCKDASGDASTKQYTPLISANQYQSGITSVDFKGKILDGECYMEYTMFPKSKVAIVLYYENINKADLLKKKIKQKK